MVTPTNPLHAASKQYVDNLFSSGGIPPFNSVVAKTTANINISSPGATHDGITLVSGDRLLVASQTTASQNGIYVFNGGTSALTRASDADDQSEFTPARQVFVQSGTLYANTGWAVGNISKPVIGTDTITFTQVSGAASYTPGNGLSLNGQQFSAVGVNGQIVVSGSGIGLATTGVSAGTFTKVTVDTFGRVTSATNATPSDIGAQPVDTTLTALSNFNSNGLMVQTALDTFTSRTITGTSGRVSVTNGDGVSGNPTIDLATSGVSAGTYNSVTVDAYGRVISGSVNSTEFIATSLSNGESGATAIGRAVYSSGGGVYKLAVANSAPTAKVIGFVADTSVASNANGSIAINGVITATTGQWDAVTSQSGGLTINAQYYLSNTNAGQITTSAPTSGVLAPVGIALSTTKLKIDLKSIILL